MKVSKKLLVLANDDKASACSGYLRSEVEKIFNRIGVSSDDADLDWIIYAEQYKKQSLINESLLTDYIKSLGLQKIRKSHKFYNSFKYCYDLVAALLILSCALPFLAVIIALLKADSSGPVFFRQLRIGFLGRPFYIWKFRTMYVGSSRRRPRNVGPVVKISNDPRITRMGRFLRRYKIDEMPQLINVIIGEMSLVGPRPLPIEESLCIADEYFARYAVRPGLTGMWQALAPNTNDLIQKLTLDRQYALHYSLQLDIELVLKTIPVILAGEKTLSANSEFYESDARDPKTGTNN